MSSCVDKSLKMRIFDVRDEVSVVCVRAMAVCE